MGNSFEFKMELMSCRCSRTPHNTEFCHFTLWFCEDGTVMYHKLQRLCTALFAY